jgi:hypothetical protein
MMRGRAAAICDGSGTMKRLMTPIRISSSTMPMAASTVNAPTTRAPLRDVARAL